MEAIAIAPKGRILVVDDQRNMRATTAMLLRAEGYEVDEAGGGEEALAMLSARPVELLVTDLKMEPIDGLTLLKRALEVAPAAQVIVMTAYGSIESAVEAMRRGAYDYITKPFDIDVLTLGVEKALNERGLRREVARLRREVARRRIRANTSCIGCALPMMFSKR